MDPWNRNETSLRTPHKSGCYHWMGTMRAIAILGNRTPIGSRYSSSSFSSSSSFLFFHRRTIFNEKAIKGTNDAIRFGPIALCAPFLCVCVRVCMCVCMCDRLSLISVPDHQYSHFPSPSFFPHIPNDCFMLFFCT